MGKSKLDYKVNIIVNRAIWQQFVLNSRKNLGLSGSACLMFLMTMFNSGGELGAVSSIVEQILQPTIMKEVDKGIKKIKESKIHAKKK